MNSAVVVAAARLFRGRRRRRERCGVFSFFLESERGVVSASEFSRKLAR